MLRQNLIQYCSNAKDFFCMDVNICCLSLKSAHPWLVNENTRMRQREPLFRRSCRQKDRRHARGLSDANCRYIIANELNRVVNGQTSGDRSARAVDVKGNVSFRIFCFQEEQLSRHQIRNVVIDWCTDEDDA